MEKPIATLTPFERLSLMNQLEILKKLYPDNANGYDDQIEILHGGYTIRYGELFNYVFEEMPMEECEYVYNVRTACASVENYDKAAARNEPARREEIVSPQT